MRERIQVYIDPETKRRIVLAATKYNASLTDYCFNAIQERLAEDDVMEHEQIEVPIKHTHDANLIADLCALREKIKIARDGQPLDLDIIFDELHEERERELLGLR